MQILRLFEIVYILLEQKMVTAKALAERFEVSQRTIYRDIDILCQGGIPIYTEKGKGGGISLLPDFVLNKSLLSEQEQNEILLALHGFSSGKTAATNRILEKLSAMFNKAPVDWLEVDFSPWDFSNNDFFTTLKTAILEHRIVEFDYFSIYGKTSIKKSRRRIEPVQLWFKSGAWYIKGFCLSRQEVRTFKASRVMNLQLTNKVFTERNLAAVRPKDGPDEGKNTDLQIKLKIEPAMFHRVFDEFGENQVEKQPDGSFVVTVMWPEDDWVYGRILSYGEYAEVLEPEHIREIIKRKTQKTSEKYV